MVRRGSPVRFFPRAFFVAALLLLPVTAGLFQAANATPSGNIVLNPGFEAGSVTGSAVSWTFGGQLTRAIRSSVPAPYEGSQSLLLLGASVGEVVAQSQSRPVPPGATVIFSAWVNDNVDPTELAVAFFSASGAPLGRATSDIHATGAWTFVSGSGVAPSQTARAALQILSGGVMSSQVDETWLEFTPAVNLPPTASFTTQVTELRVVANAASSSDVDGTIASYSWDWGDATSGSGVSASHTYAASGTYTVTLVVTDNLGATGSVQHSVSVVGPVFTEDFESGLDGWTVDGSAASIDCSAGAPGCSLRMDPACCGYSSLNVATSLSVVAPTRVVVNFVVSSICGDSDTDFAVVLNGEAVALHLNDGAGCSNNVVTLHVVSTGARPPVFSFTANTWYSASMLFDPVAKTVRVDIRTLGGTLVGSAGPLVYSATATEISALDVIASDYATESVVTHLDTIRIYQ